MDAAKGELFKLGIEMLRSSTMLDRTRVRCHCGSNVWQQSSTWQKRSS